MSPRNGVNTPCSAQSWTWIAAPLLLSLAGCGGGGYNATSSAPFAVSSVSPAAVDFGNTLVGTTAPAATLAYRNLGAAPLAITAISASGDYAESNNCGNSLAVGAACNIDITFTPTVPGPRNGTLQITGAAAQSVSLSGVGVRMHSLQLSWDPSSSAVIGYIVFRSPKPDGPFMPLNSTPTAATSFSDRARGGQNWYYYVTAVNQELIESAPSNVARAAVPP